MYVHIVNIQCWLYDQHTPLTTWKFEQSLNLRLKGDNLLPLPSNHLIWHDTIGVMIKIIFICCLLQMFSKKSTSIIIIIFTLCPNGKKTSI
jgi:hypothetical protein